jgi:hypothetical protein
MHRCGLRWHLINISGKRNLLGPHRQRINQAAETPVTFHSMYVRMIEAGQNYQPHQFLPTLEPNLTNRRIETFIQHMET